MEAYRIKNVSFAYPKQDHYALYQLDATIYEGEFIVLCGSSGSGKSTLLRHLNPALKPNGRMTGDVKCKSHQIGYVFQQPDHQIVTDIVWHELAFGLESLGRNPEEIRLRVAEISEFFGISSWFYQKTNELSGGQKQLLNLASVMVMEPDVLLLDEPTAQLDPIAANDFFSMLEKIQRELGTTIIICEHRVQEVMKMADRVLVLDQGKMIGFDEPKKLCMMLKEQKHFFYDAMPVTMRIALEVGNYEINQYEEIPMDIREGKQWLRKMHPDEKVERSISTETNQEVMLQVKEAWYRYERDSKDVIKDLSLQVKQGELFGILGGNGAGKTTLLQILSGRREAYRGRMKWSVLEDEIGMLSQNPEDLFSKKTVREELLEVNSKIEEMVEFLELGHILEHHPYDISGGEQQRVALGKLLLRSPKVLLLDEPTKGLDIYYQRKLASILNELKNQGVTILVVSHDVEFCSRYMDRCGYMFDGKILRVGSPREFFLGNRFYTTIANRMSRYQIENAILEEDVIEACRCKKIDDKKSKKEEPMPCPIQAMEEKSTKSNQAAWMNLMLLAEIVIVCCSFFFFRNAHYYETALLMIACTILTFFLGIEKRKLRTREVVTIAVMIAFGVVGRCAFFMVPQFKPMVAIVVIGGLVMGNQIGFFLGAMTAFISNFMFGQGPWTPWQMLALGVIGLIAGSLGATKIGSKKIPMMILGGLLTFFLYGGIVDAWTILLMQKIPTWQSALSVYTMAVPFNLVHSVATMIFLFVLMEPMSEKMNRLKQKYEMNF